MLHVGIFFWIWSGLSFDKTDFFERKLVQGGVCRILGLYLPTLQLRVARVTEHVGMKTKSKTAENCLYASHCTFFVEVIFSDCDRLSYAEELICNLV